MLKRKNGYVEMILFSINQAFDMLPASEDIITMFTVPVPERMEKQLNFSAFEAGHGLCKEEKRANDGIPP